MAGFYETMLSNLSNLPAQSSYKPAASSVFGNAATKSALAGIVDRNISTLQKNVTNAQNQLKEAKALSKANPTKSSEQLLNDYYYNQYKSGKFGGVLNSYKTLPDAALKSMAQEKAHQAMKSLKNNIYGQLNYSNDIMTALLANQANANKYSSAVTSAQKAVTNAKNELNYAKNNRAAQLAAGKDAVSWGLTAKNAEQKGISDAAKMYTNAMQNEAKRNAIMNAAIGTIGNFGAIGNLGAGGVQ